ncbi:carboxypeptidase regulatory-like domain-containing protein [Dyella flagellata]|uniref:Methylamine utilization protein n=1 Tax=Dyella flagellata TaxID=1867833 RepID=A0ABQ5XB82_9GAMM|nr:carboxypeptidase regulatory-like domain-containing protein [Dyella flagellata]GLQ87876.1 methylamine utilization protein [Dyella flagellata]
MKRWGSRLLCVFVWGAAMAAQAGTLTVSAIDSHGHAVGDAVISIDRANPPAAASTHYVDQKAETFIPYVEVMHPGDSVVFRNSDNTRHHVYSFSPLAAFQFILSPGESSAPVLLDHTGIIAVGCNIHDRMIAYLVVTADQSQVTSKQGKARFDGLPPGRYTVRIWHPQLSPGHAPASVTVDVPAEGAAPALPFTLRLLPDPRGSADREQLDY